MRGGRVAIQRHTARVQRVGSTHSRPCKYYCRWAHYTRPAGLLLPERCPGRAPGDAATLRRPARAHAGNQRTCRSSASASCRSLWATRTAGDDRSSCCARRHGATSAAPRCCPSPQPAWDDGKRRSARMAAVRLGGARLGPGGGRRGAMARAASGAPGAAGWARWLGARGRPARLQRCARARLFVCRAPRGERGCSLAAPGAAPARACPHVLAHVLATRLRRDQDRPLQTPPAHTPAATAPPQATSRRAKREHHHSADCPTAGPPARRTINLQPARLPPAASRHERHSASHPPSQRAPAAAPPA